MMVRVLASLALASAVMALAAAVSMVLGNPTAINGVIGAGFWSVTFAVLAAHAHQQNRRRH